jgi:hypothetical protein
MHPGQESQPSSPLAMNDTGKGASPAVSYLEYAAGDPSHRKGRILFWIAASFCALALPLGCVYFEYASVAGLISLVLAFGAYLRRRRVAPRTALDVHIKIVLLLAFCCILPTAWYVWKTSEWGQPASSFEADEQMDRADLIIDACAQYASDHDGAFPKDLPSLLRSGRLSPRVLNRNMRVRDISTSTDGEIELRSDFLYLGGDLGGSWPPSHRVIILISKKEFEKYGGPGRAVGYADGSGFCHNRHLAEVFAACNKERAAHGLPPIAP